MFEHHMLAQKCNWSLLRIFRVIVQERSLNQAAVKLSLTQSAVSQSLKRLETQIGSTLLIRHGGKFALTPMGEIIFDVSVNIYNQLLEVEQRLNVQNNMISGSIHLLLVSRIESKRFDEVLHQFHKKYPLVDFQVHIHKSSEIQQMLLQKIPAIGIALSRQIHHKLNYDHLIAQKYALYCAERHSLYHQDIQNLEQISGHGFIAFQSDQLDDPASALYHVRQKILEQNRLLVSTNNLDEVIRFIRSGFGIGFLPQHVVHHHPDAHLFKQLPPFPYISVVPVYVMWHQDRPLSVAEQYLLHDLHLAFSKES